MGSTGDLCSLMHSCIYFCWMCQYNCAGTVPLRKRQKPPSFPVLRALQRASPYLNIITLIKYLISKPLKFPWFIKIFLLFIRVLNKLFDTLGKEDKFCPRRHIGWEQTAILASSSFMNSHSNTFKIKGHCFSISSFENENFPFRKNARAYVMTRCLRTLTDEAWKPEDGTNHRVILWLLHTLRQTHIRACTHTITVTIF